jgi:hypothetical protein
LLNTKFRERWFRVISKNSFLAPHVVVVVVVVARGGGFLFIVPSPLQRYLGSSLCRRLWLLAADALPLRDDSSATVILIFISGQPQQQQTDNKPAAGIATDARHPPITGIRGRGWKQ